MAQNGSFNEPLPLQTPRETLATNFESSELLKETLKKQKSGQNALAGRNHLVLFGFKRNGVVFLKNTVGITVVWIIFFCGCENCFFLVVEILRMRGQATAFRGLFARFKPLRGPGYLLKCSKLRQHGVCVFSQTKGFVLARILLKNTGKKIDHNRKKKTRKVYITVHPNRKAKSFKHR